MKKVTISLDETSLRVNKLHKALAVLEYPVSEKEVQAHKAGSSTLKQVRALQKDLKTGFDDSLLMDQATYDVIVEKLRRKKLIDKPYLFTVSGKVYLRSSELVKKQKLIAVDVDLKGAATYRQVKNIREIMKDGGFEYLGEASSDANGSYMIEFFSWQFARAERKMADVVVFAVQDDEIIGRSRMVNSQDYSDLGEVQNLNVLITKSDGKTEYESLMEKLNVFLKESHVKLIKLAASADQIQFAAHELDLDENKIKLAVQAEVLLVPKKDQNEKKSQNSKNKSHELLYGIGRQKIKLDWLVLHKMKKEDLKAAITRSMASIIIEKFSDAEIEAFLKFIHDNTASFVLDHTSENQTVSLDKHLSVALPKKQQREVFINALQSFNNNGNNGDSRKVDYKKFWNEYLPGIKEFKEDPKLISNLLLSQQLTMISGNHQPLVEELQVHRKLTTSTNLLELKQEEWGKIISKTGVPEFIKGDNEAERIKTYAGQIQSLLHAAYPTQKIAVMLKNQELPLKDPKTHSGLSTFLSDNDQFDIGSSRVHEFENEIKAAAPENYESVKQELKRMQRIFQVSPTPETMSVLMESELDSAYSIASMPKKIFIQMNSDALGGDLMAEAVYQRASHMSMRASEHAMKLHDVSQAEAPNLVYSEADYHEVMSALQKNVPNYSQLFGSPDICECEQCRSVYSAAAYFVDLLRFLWRGAKNADNKSPLDMFALRRPDLLHLPLTCENTNTIIPYIDLVNEVMEYYTYHGALDSHAAHDTGETTEDELRANPQNFEPEAYRVLKNAVYPFSLPYHQPLDVIRTYSDHLKTERYDVMKSMQKNFTQTTNRAIEAEALRISEEEYIVLTGKKFDDTSDTKQLHEYFGYTNPAHLEKMAGTGVTDGIHEFLRRSGMKYIDLVELIKTKFINPYQYAVDFLEDLFAKSTLSPAAIYTKLKQINAGTLIPQTDAGIMAALTPASITSPDFITWTQAHFNDFNKVITLYQANSMCDLNTTCLRTVDNVYNAVGSSGIINNTWSKMHRFIRLWRKLGWSIHEVDLMLAALDESDITPGTISKLAKAVLLNKQIKLPLNKLATTWGSIDTYGDQSLYKKLFLNKAVQRIDLAFEADQFGNYLTDATQKLQGHVPAILAAFRMSEDDLRSIVKTATVIDGGNPRPINLVTDVLNSSNLSIIYRYTVLSKALKLKVPDFCLISQLFNAAPFSSWDIQQKKFISISPASTYDFCKLASSIKETGFKPAVLEYIFNGTLPAESTLGLNEDKAKSTARAIHDAFVAIEQNYPDTLTTPLTVDLIRSYLSFSFNADVVSHLMGIVQSQQSFSVLTDLGLAIAIPGPMTPKFSYTALSGLLVCKGSMTDAERIALKALVGANDNFKNAVDTLYTLSKTLQPGSPQYSVVLDPNLPVTITEILTPKYTYTKASGRLTCTGVMSDDEKTSLKALAGVNANFQSAVDTIYRMPEDFIKENFGGVFNPMNPALIILVNHPAQSSESTLEERLQLIYDNYLPLLKQKLREDAITQHIASLIGLSEEATVVLIKNDIQSIITSLVQQGFSAEYFSDVNWNTSALKRTDQEINFNWGNGSPDPLVPVDNFSVRWQTYLSPPSSGEYTLTAEVQEADEAFKLYLDDALILEKPAADVRISWEAIAPLNAALMHRLTLEYSETAQKAGATLSWKTATTALQTIPSSSAFPAEVIDQFIANAVVYHRAAKFISGFKLNEREISHFVNFSADFANINFKAITAVHWKRLNDYAQLRNEAPQTQATLVDTFAAANFTNPVPTLLSLTDLLYRATAWDNNTITYLVNTHFTLSKNDFKNEIALSKLNEAVKLTLKTGIAAQALAQWAAVETDFDNLNKTAELVKSTVKAKYEEEDWLKLAGDLSDQIREDQKQALISYLLTKSELMDWGVKDADGLFEYFLIDVQMGACMDTSRIVQANAAVQMFVNRCLLNMESDKETGVEKGVSPDAIDADRWDWMKYYRVWEVNRKIFLYPENWLEPEWRDDRSPFFKELESELTQNDITDRSVETAFRNYLTKLNAVANLDVCGVYQENDKAGVLKLLHVFGRTHNAPYQFFYRTCNDVWKWSAWEKVQVDIRMTEDGDNSGVHLVPIVWKSRLFIFWTEFIEKQEQASFQKEKGGEQTFEDISKKSPSNLKSRKYWEVRLGWSENIDGKWNAKQLSKEFLKVYSGYLTDPIKSIMLKTEILQDGLYLKPYARFTGDGGWSELGRFKSADIQSKLLTLGTTGGLAFQYESAARYQTNFEKHQLNSTLNMWGNTYLQNTINHNLVFSNNILEKELAKDDPFFYHDSERTYFVRPETIPIVDYVKNPDQYGPAIVGFVDDSYFTTPHVPEVGPDDYMPGPEEFIPGMEYTDPVRDNFVTGGVLNTIGGGNVMTTTHETINAPFAMNREVIPMRMGRSPYQYEEKMTDSTKMGKAFGNNVYQAEKKYANFFEHIHYEKGLEFNTFYHPYSSQFVTSLNEGGVEGLMDSDTLLNASNNILYNDSGTVFVDTYNPNFYQGYVKEAPTSNDYNPGERYTYYKENVCFDVFGANSIYNWELFFHAPLYIATRLSKNGKYEEALKWFHYIFDPTTDEMPLVGQSETSRYWKVLPFKTTPAENLEAWFMSLTPNTNPASSAENATIKEWREKPFKPFVVARNRPLAFMKNVVLKYVENLRAWGDAQFRMFTRETVNEALQIYVIANHILGPRPEFVPKRGEVKAETYDSLKNKWDDFSNALVELENIFPYSSEIPVSGGDSGPNLLGVGSSLYFCIPSNEKLMEHWDTVADRLYKIRHCMDIDGVERHLALFSPPIDPAMLINAAAQGLSLGSILSDLSSSPPIYRFNYLMQKANDFCIEVKSLGSTLLSVLEKKDGEELGRLRTSHETMMLELMTTIKERQILEAKSNKDGLLKSRETAQFKVEHYHALLSEEVTAIPASPTIDANLTADSQLPMDTSIAEITTGADDSLVDSDESGVKIINKEKEDMDLSLGAMIAQQIATGTEGIAGLMNFIPSFSGNIEPFGCGVTMSYGGSNIAGGMSGLAKIPQGIGALLSYMASHSAKIAGFIRREQEWALQANLAAKEIIQLDKQITSADIRIQVAEKELENHLTQIENAKQVELFLKNKFTNQELYQWMKEQLFAVYKQSYNMAYDIAKKVEKCYRFETGNEITNFIQYGYWDNTQQGLCAGEKLLLALRQMEKSFMEENKRELELSKNISIALLNPLALQELKTTGKCFIAIPEELYDLDYQGHYFRRIKSVGLSIPCIVGPFTTVNCTLRLVKNAIRVDTTMGDDGYQHNNDEGIWIDDDRFRENNIPVKSIASSTGQRDNGTFELNFRDERYLPFEGAGAISEWKIEFTSDPDLRQFDYSTISDVILHIKYTAREDAGLFKENAAAYIKDFLMNVADLRVQPLMRMFSMRHDFPTEWHKFLYPVVPGTDQAMTITLQKEHFPFFTQNRDINVKKVEVLVKADRAGDYKMILTAVDLTDVTMTSSEITMPENATYGNMQKATLVETTANVNVDVIKVFSPITMKFKHTSDGNYHSINAQPEEISEVIVVLHYALG